MRAHHHGQHVGLAVGQVDQAGGRHLGGHLGDPLVAFDPAHALLRPPRKPSVAFSRAHIHASSTPSGSRSGVTAYVGADTCRAVLHNSAAPGPTLLAIEIEFRRVLQAQNDRVCPMRYWVCAQCGAMMSRHSTHRCRRSGRPLWFRPSHRRPSGCSPSDRPKIVPSMSWPFCRDDHLPDRIAQIPLLPSASIRSSMRSPKRPK